MTEVREEHAGAASRVNIFEVAPKTSAYGPRADEPRAIFTNGKARFDDPGVRSQLPRAWAVGGLAALGVALAVFLLTLPGSPRQAGRAWLAIPDIGFPVVVTGKQRRANRATRPTKAHVRHVKAEHVRSAKPRRKPPDAATPASRSQQGVPQDEAVVVPPSAVPASPQAEPPRAGPEFL